MMNSQDDSPLKKYQDDDQRWAAVVARDAEADGHFVYAVETTGIYCMPSSASRLPKRKNVVFFDTAEAAHAAGFRASLRASSGDKAAITRRAAMIADICRLIDGAEEPPTLERLALHAGMSSFHFHRVFKAQTGLTPKAYASAARARRLRVGLGAGSSVTNAIYDAGFNSNSRFYEASADLLGMSARDYKDQGHNNEIRFAVGQASLGAILVAQSQRGVCAILLGDDPDQLVRELQDTFRKAVLIGGDTEFERVVAQVIGFVEAPEVGLDLPLDIQGTAFQERVWQVLRRIPVGESLTYGEVAKQIGSPKATRAVAQACASNRLAVAIPCHRVVLRDGGIGGYRWGVERKVELRRLESKVSSK
jgi:AraC family transcriptional regulator, regulatory protein of adaptative response / methylated-DNA-[protein]-cysteine methyltransferase